MKCPFNLFLSVVLQSLHFVSINWGCHHFSMFFSYFVYRSDWLIFCCCALTARESSLMFASKVEKLDKKAVIVGHLVSLYISYCLAVDLLILPLSPTHSFHLPVSVFPSGSFCVSLSIAPSLFPSISPLHYQHKCYSNIHNSDPTFQSDCPDHHQARKWMELLCAKKNLHQTWDSFLCSSKLSDMCAWVFVAYKSLCGPCEMLWKG